MEISEPLVLAKLPRPQSDQSKIYLSEIHGLTNGLRRRRQELCAAVDGDSINIYEIRHGRNLSSYTVPPDSVFPCPPCSLHTRSNNEERIRNTYYTTVRRNETRLTVVQEVLGRASQQSLSKSIQLENSPHQVVQLETLAATDSYNIAVVRENGEFEIWNADLSSCTRRGKCVASTTGARLVAVRWLSLNQAASSLLKARPDILAVSDANCSFLVAVFDATNSQGSGGVSSIELGAWRLSKSTSVVVTEQSMEQVLFHKFTTPTPLVLRQHDSISFAFKETRLVVKTQSKTLIYDLTSIDLRQMQEIPQTSSGNLSSIAISDSLMLSSTSASLLLYNTRFQSLQTKLDLQDKTGAKRKRNNLLGGPFTLTHYFTGLNRIVAIRRNHLIAIDLQPVAGENLSTATKQTSLLINNIGRGVTFSDRLRVPHQPSESLVGRVNSRVEALSQWETTVKQLDQFLRDEAFDKFEDVYLEQLTDKNTSRLKESQIITNHKLDYGISKIFEYQPIADEASRDSAQGLKLAIVAHKIVEALAVRGLLAVERIAKGLHVSLSSKLETAQFGTVSRSLIESDSSLGLLYIYLEGAPFMTCQELCSSVLLLLRRAVATVNTANSTVIARSQSPIHNTLDLTIAAKAPAAQTDTKSNTINDCLCIAIERLAETSNDLLSGLMRKNFAQREIIALVQFLRQQLFHSGYTRSLQAQSYPSPPPSDIESSAEGRLHLSKEAGVTLPAIAHTLSSCIDAIGPIGVLGFGDDEEFVHSLIPELSSEVSKATEALQDATYMQGILRETLRFVESTAGTQTLSKGKKISNTSISQSKPGMITTLYAEPGVDGDFEQASSVLPLSLRVEGKLSGLKVRKGDGRISKRSEREMGMRQDRLRGPYAFERLNL